MDKAQAIFSKKQADCEIYKAEVIKVLRSESSFGSDVLNELINSCIKELEALEKEIECYQKELDDANVVQRDIKQKYENLLSWANLYKKAGMESKKMIISQLIKAVRVRRDYELEIDFNIAYEQFRLGI